MLFPAGRSNELPRSEASSIYYTETYGIEGLFDFLISVIRWMTIACGVATVIMATIARRLEPRAAE